MKRILFIIFVISFFAIPAHAFETKGFSHPFGVTVDPKTGLIYVSNMNGSGEKKDDNGFISRLKEDGTLDLLKFIDGIEKLVELNAPKGMQVIGNFLYVADIDAVRVFDITNAKPLFNVNFGDYPIKHFYDLTIGPDEALYATDGPGNAVYRIDVMKGHRVTPFIKDDVLGEPHGITWFSSKQVFLIGGWKSGQVLAFNKSGQQQPYPGIFLETVEGITTDMRGSAYVASTKMNSVYRISINGALYPYVTGVDTPIGATFQRIGQLVLVVSYRNSALVSYPAVK